MSQTLYADSPVLLAAWRLDRDARSYEDIAAWQEPALFTIEVRAAFRPLRDGSMA